MLTDLKAKAWDETPAVTESYMNFSTMLVPLDTGDLSFADTVEELESDGQLIVAATGQIAPDGKPLVRLVGQVPVLLANLQDGWGMTFDEARAHIEK